MNTVCMTVYKKYYDSIILHDEDVWDGEYRTYGEMWEGEHYSVVPDDHTNCACLNTCGLCIHK